MSERQKIFHENEQSSQEYPQKYNINILNDYCLEHIFKFLPIADRIRLGKGEHSMLSN
jgi:hypothetical protein